MADGGADATPDAMPDGGGDAGLDAMMASCTDGVMNGDETDMDCGGGSCDACGDGAMCGEASDCASGVCDAGTCAAPDCGDAVVNGDEVCDPSAPEMPCCLADCTGVAGAGATCGDDPDDAGCGAAPVCDGAGASAANCGAASEADGTACTDDGMFCTGAETCQAGSCESAGGPCPGADGDGDCAESCDEDADSCTGFDPADSVCDDGLFCTGADACDAAGSCRSMGDPCAGPDGDGDCSESCDEAADDCTAPDAADSRCDDGLFCTAVDACDGAGACSGSGDPCVGPDGDGDCAESCDEADDDCMGPDPAATRCDDGEFCTVTDSCDGGGACTGTGDPCAGTASTCVADGCVARTVFYRGDFLVNGEDRVGSYDPGTGVAGALALVGLEGASEVDTFAFSDDGGLLAVGGRDTAADPFVLNLYAGDFTGAPITLADSTATTNAAVDFGRIVFSPDGANVAFTADFDINGAMGLFVVPTTGGAVRRLTPLPTGNQDVGRMVWPDNDHVVLLGDVVTDAVVGAYSVDVTAAVPTLVDLVPMADLSTTADVSNFDVDVDSAGRVYFRSDHMADGTFLLYRANVDGTGLEVVPGTQLLRGDVSAATVGSFGLSPSGTLLAFGVDAPFAGLFQVHVLDLSDAAAISTVVSDVTSTPPAGGALGPSFFHHLNWSPDGTQIAVVADWPVGGSEQDNDFAVFILPTRAPAGGTRVLVPSAFGANMDANDAVFSADGGYLFVRGDLLVNNDTVLFETSDFTTADQALAPLLVQSAPPGGDIFQVVARP